MRKQNELFEHRPLEIVYELGATEFLGRIIHSGQLSRVLPSSVRPGSRNDEIWLEQHEPQFGRHRRRLHDFSTSATNGDGTHDKKRNIGAKLRGKLEQAVLLQAGREKLVQTD